MKFLCALIIGYVSIVISDFMIHRNIMHGKWSFVTSPGRFFRMWLYPHYVQHLQAHHSHSISAKAELLEGRPVPETLKFRMERKFRDQHWSRRALVCSDHGISINSSACLFSFLSLFLLTPHSLVVLGTGMIWGWELALVSLFLILLPAYNHYHHRFYHMKKHVRERLAPWHLRWIMLSREVGRISEEHMMHHHDKLRKDDFYNLLPFGRYILRPIFGRY